MGKTGIEWTDTTWNPVRGCSRVSEGCRNCYAERMAARFTTISATSAGPFAGFAHMTGAGPRWTGAVELIESKLTEPLHWKRPRRVFVNSMSDLFHERLSDEAIDRVFAVMALCPQHTFRALTKRPARMRAWIQRLQAMADNWAPNTKSGKFTPSNVLNLRHMHRTFGHGPAFPYLPWPIPNVWLGVSVEDQATADQRIPELLATPAVLRFVSYEPALGPVDFTRLLVTKTQYQTPALAETSFNALTGSGTYPSRITGIPIECYSDRLDWVIIGGESGPGARPFAVEWARSAVRQCKAAGVACFVKQLGAHIRGDSSEFPTVDWEIKDGHGFGLCDRKGGDIEEWPADLRLREFPVA